MALIFPTSFDEQVKFFKENKSLFSSQERNSLQAELNFLEEFGLKSPEGPLRDRSGAATPAADFQRFLSNFQRAFKQGQKRIKSGIQEARKIIQREQTALANKFDFSGLSPEQVQRELNVLQGSSEIQSRLDKIQQNIDDLNKNGEDTTDFVKSLEQFQPRLTQTAEELSGTQFTPEGSVRTDSGFVPRDESISKQEGAEGQIAPGVSIVPDGDQFKIIDRETGATIETGFADKSAANARATQLQSGSAPNVQGRPDLFAVEPTGDQQVRDLQLEGGGTVAPRTATTDELAQQQAGTLESFNAANGLNAPPTAITGASAAASASAATGSVAGDQVITAAQQSVEQKTAQALAENPNITITKELRADFLAQAFDELRGNKAFQEVIRNTEFDLGVSLNRLVEDTRLRELGTAETFKRNLEGQRQSLRDRGLIFGGADGGIRGQEEKKLADATNLQLQGQSTQFRRGLEDLNLQGERRLGTDFLSARAPSFGSTQQVGRVISGSPVFQPGRNIDLVQPRGGQLGSLPRQIEADALTRAGELETAFGEKFTQFE